MTHKLSLKDLDLKGKKALIRVDFNVPIDRGIIQEDSRIRASLPTIQYVLKQGGSVILMSHLGRPNQKFESEFSLAPCAERLEELLHRPVIMAPDCIGPEVSKMAASLQPGEILLLENLRFHAGEELPDKEPDFAAKLAQLGDLYINDAFGTAHRAHASTVLIPKFFPGLSAAGFLMEREIAYLSLTLVHPERPYYAILGGAKISTKFKVIESLMRHADKLFIGGAMAYTFLKAENKSIGRSLVEEGFILPAHQLLQSSQSLNCQLCLPIDLVIARKVDSHAESRVIHVDEGIPEDFQGVDIGPETIQIYTQELKKAKTIFWNGPLGVFECPPFNHGTQTIAKLLSTLKATVIVGGGDSLAAIEQAEVGDKMSHLSTGGGASLEFIECGHLPGIDALSDR